MKGAEGRGVEGIRDRKCSGEEGLNGIEADTVCGIDTEPAVSAEWKEDGLRDGRCRCRDSEGSGFGDEDWVARIEELGWTGRLGAGGYG